MVSSVLTIEEKGTRKALNEKSETQPPMTSLETIKKSLSSTFQSVEGLYAIVVTDRDGVTILKTNADFAVRPTFLAAHGVALEQTAKMGLGESKHMICSYNQHKMILLNYNPILITLIGSSDMNTGLVLALKSELEPIVKHLHTVVFAQT